MQSSVHLCNKILHKITTFSLCHEFSFSHTFVPISAVASNSITFSCVRQHTIWYFQSNDSHDTVAYSTALILVYLTSGCIRDPETGGRLISWSFVHFPFMNVSSKPSRVRLPRSVSGQADTIQSPHFRQERCCYPDTYCDTRKKKRLIASWRRDFALWTAVAEAATFFVAATELR